MYDAEHIVGVKHCQCSCACFFTFPRCMEVLDSKWTTLQSQMTNYCAGHFVVQPIEMRRCHKLCIWDSPTASRISHEPQIRRNPLCLAEERKRIPLKNDDICD